MSATNQSATHDLPLLLTVVEVKNLLRYGSTWAVYVAVRDGRIPAAIDQPGRRKLLFRRSDMLDFIAGKWVPPQQPVAPARTKRTKNTRTTKVKDKQPQQTELEGYIASQRAAS